MNILQYAISLKEKLLAKGKAFEFFKPGKSLAAVVEDAEHTLGESRPAGVVFPGSRPAIKATPPASTVAEIKAELSRSSAKIAALLPQAKVELETEAARLKAEIAAANASIATANARADAAKPKTPTDAETEKRIQQRTMQILGAAGIAGITVTAKQQTKTTPSGIERTRAAIRQQISTKQ